MEGSSVEELNTVAATLGPRENPSTEAAMYRNRARDAWRRISQAITVGLRPTKHDQAQMSRYLRLAQVATEADGSVFI